MDFNQNQQMNQQNQQNPQDPYYVSSNQPYTPPPQSNRPANNGMSIASMVLGIASIVMCCTGFMSLPLGALGLLLAILTKRKGKALPGMSIAGMVTSIIGLLLGVFMIIYLIVFAVMSEDPTFQNEYLDPLYEEAYGMDYEEFMEYFGLE